MEILFASIYKVSPFYTFVFEVSIVMGYCLKVKFITMWMACSKLISVIDAINEITHIIKSGHWQQRSRERCV